jgi:hemoglobin
MSTKTLYERLGGYDAMCAVSDDLLPRLMSDSRLKRFWEHRGEDGIKREKQLLVDFLCSSAGGPMYYTGRDMKISHKGMKISEADWTALLATSMRPWMPLKFHRLSVARWLPSCNP